MGDSNTAAAAAKGDGGEKDVGQYWLPVSPEEIERLNRQHSLLKQVWYGNRPSLLWIPKDKLGDGSDKPVKCLDAACGTGIWSLEASEELKPQNSHFVLVDYNTNSAQTYIPNLPSNFELFGVNLLEDFLESGEPLAQYTGQFDIIHQRLVFFAFKPSDYRRIFGEYLNLLKPGGYIQLEEFLPRDMLLGPAWMQTTQWAQQLCQKAGLEINVAEQLPEILKELGYEIVVEETYDAQFTGEAAKDPRIKEDLAKWYVETGKAVVIKGREFGMISEQAWEEHGKMLQAESEKLDEHPEYSFKACVIVARKKA